jgi:ABC-type lipoprotein export system ATPase subunit
MGAAPLLEVKDLVKHFPIHKGFIMSKQVGAVKAVDGVSFSINKGETLGLVGESGCGKSTTGRLILRLIEATSGEVWFEGQNILNLGREEMRELRRDMQIIFQDPYASLNPRMTVGDIIGEPLQIHGIARGREKEQRVKELLEVVGLASYHARRYPHEFSGGQRQRISFPHASACLCPYSTVSLTTDRFRRGSPPKKSTSTRSRPSLFSKRKSIALQAVARGMFNLSPPKAPVPAKQYRHRRLQSWDTFKQRALRE